MNKKKGFVLLSLVLLATLVVSCAYVPVKDSLAVNLSVPAYDNVVPQPDTTGMTMSVTLSNGTKTITKGSLSFTLEDLAEGTWNYEASASKGASKLYEKSGSVTIT